MSASPVPDAPTPFDASWRQEAGDGLDADGMALIDQAVAWAEPRFEGQQALTGESLASHGAGVVRILAGMHTDAATRAAALLAALLTDLTAPAPALRNDPVAAAFGQEVARLVQGTRALLRLGVVARHASDVAAESGSQKEMQRKMLLAMAADLRIVLMRLASRLHAALARREQDALYRRVRARDPGPVRAVGQPARHLADQVEMEDLAFRFLEPDRYKQIARLLEEKRVEREAFIAGAIERLQSALAASGVHAEVSGRPKHIYSIWNKMRIKRLDFAQMYDLRALRVIVDDVRDCYTALGMVHEMWTPIAEEFDDYISRPKPNGYRSLHTVVADHDGRPFEVQIRTREMHQFAEYGMAAHWRYKEAGAKGGQVSASSEYDRQLSWMRQLLAWNSEVEAGDQAPVVPAAPEPARPATRGAGKTRRAAAEPAQSDERIYVMMPQACDRAAGRRHAGGFRLSPAHRPGASLPRRACRWPDGAAADPVVHGADGRDHLGQVRRSVARLAQPATGLPGQSARPLQGAHVVQRHRAAAAHHAGRRWSKGTAAPGQDRRQPGAAGPEPGFARADDLYVAAAKEEFSLRQIDALFQQPAPAAEPRTRGPGGASAESAEKAARAGCWWWAWVRC